MAKVRNPLWSVEASGRFGGNLRYARARGQSRALRNRTDGAVRAIGQRRQASIIGEAGRLWTTRAGRGPEATYREYVAAVSGLNWYFMTGDILLEWNADTLMPAN